MGKAICGIFGFIGRSKDPKVTFQLANALLVKTEKRGEHATGFWACEKENGVIFYDKEPVKASVFQHRTPWKDKFAEADTDILLGHCRYSTMNSGNEKFNKNNHPHVSNDKRIALVHNGRILEYGVLKSRYETISDCDSEVLIRMFEVGRSYIGKNEELDKEFSHLTVKDHQFMGVREIFSRVHHGAMAVAIGERGEDENHETRTLWLFRDDERPLHLIDMRETLGQYFFCSEADIWRSAVESCSEIKKYFPASQPIIPLPSFQVWRIQFTPKVEEQKEKDKWNHLFEFQAWKTFEKKYESKALVPLKEWHEAVAKMKETKASWEDSVTKEEMSKAVLFTEWVGLKFRVLKTKFSDWDKADDPTKIIRPKDKAVTTIVTRLTEDEEIDKKYITTEKITNVSKSVISSSSTTSSKTAYNIRKHDDVDFSTDDDYITKAARDLVEQDTDLESLSGTTLSEGIDMKLFDEEIKELKEVIENMKTHVSNAHQEQSLAAKDFDVVMESLRDAATELKGTLCFLEKS